MKVLGLKCSGGLPLFDILCTHHDNKIHENHIEIARRYWNVERNYAAIVLVWENDMTVYSAHQLRV